jgi:uncharacterized repeat protein (TIGR03847 family)
MSKGINLLSGILDFRQEGGRNMPTNQVELDPVTHITADAIGKPGQRVFYIQAWQDNQVVSLIVEKVQVQTLAVGIEQFLAEIQTRFPDLSEAGREFDEMHMHIQPPVDPLFRVGELSLAYDSERDMACLIAEEAESAESPESGVARLWCTRSQLRALGTWGLEVSSRGRAICPQCGEPMDPAGHFCPKRNGHKHSEN